MRENIGLYHGKRKDNGEWVEGFLVKTREHTYIAYDEQFDDDLFLSPKNMFIEVIPETVGEYAGLLDEKGNRIFEDDIINFVSKDYMGFDDTGIVVFKDGCYGIKYVIDGDSGHIFDFGEAFHRIGEIGEWQDMGASGTITYKYYKMCNKWDVPALTTYFPRT